MTRSRFPHIAATICAACLVVAGWTWMRYSYAWNVDAEDLPSLRPVPAREVFERKCDWSIGRWVTIRGTLTGTPELEREFPLRDRHGHVAYVTGPEELLRPYVGEERVFMGRVVPEPTITVLVDAEAGRLHPATIAGLIVGAIGIGVFAFGLTKWLRARTEAE